jgi:hypothetical protein
MHMHARPVAPSVGFLGGAREDGWSGVELCPCYLVQYTESNFSPLAWTSDCGELSLYFLHADRPDTFNRQYCDSTHHSVQTLHHLQGASLALLFS